MILERDCYALVKITWHPDLAATVNGKPVSPIRVTPGFAAVPLRAGEHEVVVIYQPSLLKPLLLISGVSLFALCSWLLWQPQTIPLENSLTKRIANWAHDLPLRESRPR